MGDNAIEKLIIVANEVKRVEETRLEVPETLEPVIRSTIEAFKKARKLSDEQIAGLERVFHYPTASLNMITGGVKVNVVPDRAEAILDVRVTPGINLDVVKKRVINLVEESEVEGVEVVFTSCKDGYYEDPNSHAVREFINAVETATKVRPKLKLLTGGTDAPHLKTHVEIPCLGFGVGVQGMAHVSDEYTTVENLVVGLKVYAVFPLLYTVDGDKEP